MIRIVAGGMNRFPRAVAVESLISDHVVRSESFQPRLGTCDAKPFSSSQMQLSRLAGQSVFVNSARWGCGSGDVRPRGRVERRFRSLPIGSRSTVVVLPFPLVACQVCEVVRQVKLEFADPRRTYTKAFERYALELPRSMTILGVARQLGVSWDIIKDVQKCDLSRHNSKPKLKDLRQIAIDDIAVAKGHR